jgi:uncharacterized membrane protein YhaH (DUF805 family)
MVWLQLHNVVKPKGHYGRTQFLFWFFIPLVFIILLINSIWGLEILFIRISVFTNTLGEGTYFWSRLIVVLLVLFLVYLMVTALIKRCNDLKR